MTKSSKERFAMVAVFAKRDRNRRKAEQILIDKAGEVEAHFLIMRHVRPWYS